MSHPDLAALATPELGSIVRDAVAVLANRHEPAAFSELIDLTHVLGAALGESARALAEASSWAQVGDVAGTSRQAAWERWRG
jgi:hypothetical protein